MKIRGWRKTPDGYQFLWEAKEQARDYLAFSPQGDFLAVADWGRDEVAVFESATGRLERTIAAKQCWGGEFSPDGQQFAFTEEDDVVVWDWPARRPLRRLRGHLSTVTGVSFSPHGLRLASCGKDRRINVWNVPTGDLIRTMMGHRGAVIQAVFFGNDRLVSLANDGTVLVWHAELGIQLCSLREDQTNPCFRLAASSDQHWLACRLGNGDVQLYDLTPAIPCR